MSVTGFNKRRRQQEEKRRREAILQAKEQEPSGYEYALAGVIDDGRQAEEEHTSGSEVETEQKEKTGNLESKTINELRALAKEKGTTNLMAKRKSELIEILAGDNNEQ